MLVTGIITYFVIKQKNKSCKKDSDCPSNSCNISTGQCNPKSGCSSPSDCPGNICTSGQCSKCTSSLCPTDKPNCDDDTGSCFKCSSPSECPGYICNTANGLCSICTTTSCPSDKPICNDTGSCSKCTSSLQCPNYKPNCNDAGSCFKCTADTDCTNGKQCRSDGSCGDCNEGCDFKTTDQGLCYLPNKCDGICGCTDGKLCNGCSRGQNSCVDGAEVFFVDKSISFDEAKVIKNLVNPLIPTQLANYAQITQDFNAGFRNGGISSAHGWIFQDTFSNNTCWIDGASLKSVTVDPKTNQGVFLYGPKPDKNYSIDILPWSTTKWSKYD